MNGTPSGAEEEIAFWQGAIERYRADPAKSAFGAKLDPDRPVQPVILDRVRQALRPGQSAARVLDVGCGPLSTIGKKADGLELEIVGLDPLADDYQRLFDQSGLKRPHHSVNGFAERATEYFGEAAFDYVHAENSLDHCQDAGRALAELRAVCRPDAIFFFRVFVNEGEHNHYSGLHQWNFDTYNGKVIFWRPGEIHFIDEIFQLPMRFWYDETEHGPARKRRRYLNCEVHNTDLASGFVQAGAVMVRRLPRYSCLVLKRAEGFDPGQRVFAHFGFEAAPRQVATVIWPAEHDHHVLPIPPGRLKSIKLGQSQKRIGQTGQPDWDEIWSSFIPDVG